MLQLRLASWPIPSANLVYLLGLYDEAERFIARALELGHKDDGSLRLRLARIFVRRHAADPANSERHLAAASEAFSEALNFSRVGSKAVHYLEVNIRLRSSTGFLRCWRFRHIAAARVAISTHVRLPCCLSHME